MDGVLKEEPGRSHVEVPNFFEACPRKVAGLGLAAQTVLDKCKEGHTSLYREESSCKGWSEAASERVVLSWFAQLTGQPLGLA